MISQQGALQRQPMGEGSYRTTRGSRESLNASEIHQRKEKTLTSKANKQDSQPKLLTKGSSCPGTSGLIGRLTGLTAKNYGQSAPHP
ncbi:hypothetical protein XELAEV_18002844mg [Xenopus laevis]|nr:hypothetical protein XELAEV_18002844mg [Xenopus laevis]